ncbi:GNAT family N-acetyltransferase [Burkholderiaceae bacterium FT117]|uniref:GNAT family N-acetyltransferase n=1 Tax=Zeimonas sediminis TaxID=2944268 RepID=UPI0023430507|nr:GNAT family N-acetyltransferase [Zeimonas sediminis]MCM5570662.1 GNAT family N-acetyltransferase [Zeimonas sediminis]
MQQAGDNDGIGIDATDGIVLIRNANTTIGYCRFDDAGDIEYIFVNPMYRRRGHGTRLVDEVRRLTGGACRPLEPISPLGRRFFGLPPEAGQAGDRQQPAQNPCPAP